MQYKNNKRSVWVQKKGALGMNGDSYFITNLDS